jgi:hypothetical protein
LTNLTANLLGRGNKKTETRDGVAGLRPKIKANQCLVGAILVKPRDELSVTDHRYSMERGMTQVKLNATHKTISIYVTKSGRREANTPGDVTY